MGYSKLRRRFIKRPNLSGGRNKKLEIITPNMALTKHVAKMEAKNNDNDNENDTE